MEKDYSVEGFQDGRERFRVTAPFESNQLELVKILIKAGAIPKAKNIEFQIIGDEVRIVLWVKSSTRFQIEPGLNDARALLDLTVQRYLEIQPFFLAFEMLKGQVKSR
jgi:hypothetical protein